MKVYIITKGMYSDYHVCGAATSKESAQAMLKMFEDEFDKPDILELETDDFENLSRGYQVFTVSFTLSGDVKSVHQSKPDYLCDCVQGYEYKGGFFDKTPGFLIGVVARDEAHAVKVASEKRAMFYAAKLDAEGVTVDEEDSDAVRP